MGVENWADHWHLRRGNWLATLSPEEREPLRRASSSAVYEAGEAVFGPTRDPRHAYLLEQGLVRIYRIALGGKELTLAYVRPGELFGDIALIAERPRATFATTRRRSTILRIPRKAFMDVVRANNAILYQVAKKLGAALIHCQTHVEDLVFHDVRTRLIRSLLHLAQQFGRPRGGGAEVGVPLTQEEMATLIGASRQTVSEMLGDLAAAGLVERQGRELVLRDVAGLQRLVQPTDP